MLQSAPVWVAWPGLVSPEWRAGLGGTDPLAMAGGRQPRMEGKDKPRGRAPLQGWVCVWGTGPGCEGENTWAPAASPAEVCAQTLTCRLCISPCEGDGAFELRDLQRKERGFSRAIIYLGGI